MKLNFETLCSAAVLCFAGNVFAMDSNPLNDGPLNNENSNRLISISQTNARNCSNSDNEILFETFCDFSAKSIEDPVKELEDYCRDKKIGEIKYEFGCGSKGFSCQIKIGSQTYDNGEYFKSKFETIETEPSGTWTVGSGGKAAAKKAIAQHVYNAFNLAEKVGVSEKDAIEALMQVKNEKVSVKNALRNAFDALIAKARNK